MTCLSFTGLTPERTQNELRRALQRLKEEQTKREVMEAELGVQKEIASSSKFR